MEKYIKIAEKYLADDSKHLVKGLCLTIRYEELEQSDHPDFLIQERMNSCCYFFSAVRDYTDAYGTKYLLFYNN